MGRDFLFTAMGMVVPEALVELTTGKKEELSAE